MFYHKHYSEKTYIRKGQVANTDDIFAVNQLLWSIGILSIGECWVPGYGITLLFEGPEVDEDTQNLCCIKIADDSIVKTLNKV